VATSSATDAVPDRLTRLIRLSIGAALVAVMAGEDPATEFKSTTAAFQQVLDKSS